MVIHSERYGDCDPNAITISVTGTLQLSLSDIEIIRCESFLKYSATK